MATEQKVAAAQSLFDLMNLTAIKLWSVPGKEAPGYVASVLMRQAGTDATLPVTFHKREGKWWLEMPLAEVLASARQELLARYGGAGARLLSRQGQRARHHNHLQRGILALEQRAGRPQVRTVSAPVHALLIVVFGVWAGWQLIDAIGRKFMDLIEIRPGRSTRSCFRSCLAPFGSCSCLWRRSMSPTSSPSPSTASLRGSASAALRSHSHQKRRSTRVRTAEDTVAVVPNGKLADAAIINWGTRRHRLSGAKLLIGYSSTPQQSAQVGLRGDLRWHRARPG
jgi:hypothetical protein